MHASKELHAETRKKIQERIRLLREQLEKDHNDLEFETHLHMIRDLERLLK